MDKNPSMSIKADLHSTTEDKAPHCPLCNTETEIQFVVVEPLAKLKEKKVCPECKTATSSVEHLIH